MTHPDSKFTSMPVPPDATIRRAFDDFDAAVGTRRGLTDAERQALDDADQKRALDEWAERNAGSGSGSYAATWAAVYFALGVGAMWLGGLL